MRDEPSLAGKRILILEDDYLLAWDTEAALSRAGAEVIGPFAKESLAAESIRTETLDGAVTDINLRLGPSFTTAQALRNANIPFVFLTGYDQASIPAEFAEVPRVLKPVESRQIVRELARLLRCLTNRILNDAKLWEHRPVRLQCTRWSRR